MPRLPALALTALVTFLSLPPAPAAVPAAYDFQPGRTALYEIEIKAGEGNDARTHTGRVTFTVQSKQGDTTALNYNGSLTNRPTASKPNAPPPAGGIYSTSAGGFLQLDERGRAVRGPGRPGLPGWMPPMHQSQLPYLLGPLHELVLVPLPEKPGDRWETSTESPLLLTTTLARAPEPNPAFPQPPFAFFPQRTGEQPIEERITATETTTYAPRADSPDVDRTYALVTKETVAGKPRIELRTAGTVTFAEDGFLLDKASWAGEFVWRTETAERKTPVAFSARRLPPEQLARESEQARQGREDAAQRLRDRLPGLAEDLKSDNLRKARSAASELARAEAGDGDYGVAALLHDRVRSGDRSSRTEFARALVRWATPAQADLVQELIDEPDQQLRHAVIDRLAQLRAAKAIPALTVRLADDRDSWKAAAALKSFGSAAEPAVAELLRNDDPNTRREAVNLLREIGTGTSLPALQEAAAKDPDRAIRQSADAAARTIQARASQPMA